jgi:hypothetical protein
VQYVAIEINFLFRSLSVLLEDEVEHKSVQYVCFISDSVIIQSPTTIFGQVESGRCISALYVLKNYRQPLKFQRGLC